MKILLKLSYLGTNYSGFQVQKNAVTVQQRLQDAAEAVFGFRCPITGCGRTDSGVHANMYYCVLDTAEAVNSVPEEQLADALNHYLPGDISVSRANRVCDAFHPRYDVKYKEYLYLIWNERWRNPFFLDRACHYIRPLDENKMNEAALSFRGRHDFRAFMAAGSSVRDTTREIYDTEVRRDGGFVKFTVTGNGFLYNMVRIMAGTLICISDGKIPADGIPQIIAGKSRKAAGFTVSSCGLYLNRVVFKTDA